MKALNAAIAVSMLTLVASPAAAVTREDCSTVANTLPETIVNLNKMQSVFAGMDWGRVSSFLVGPQRAQAEAVRRAQGEFTAAAKKYAVALEDFNYQMQLCAR